MIETKDILIMVRHIVRRDRGVRDPQIMHPTREWFFGLLISIFVVAIGTWFCWYVYVSYTDKLVKVTESVEASVPYQAATVSEAISIFNARKQKFNEILDQAKSSPINTTSVEVETSTESISENTVPEISTAIPSL
jgi:hypothetical protein